MDYEQLLQAFRAHEYRPRGGGYVCTCGWEGSSQAEHLADVASGLVMG